MARVRTLCLGTLAHSLVVPCRRRGGRAVSAARFEAVLRAIDCRVHRVNSTVDGLASIRGTYPSPRLGFHCYSRVCELGLWPSF